MTMKMDGFHQVIAVERFMSMQGDGQVTLKISKPTYDQAEHFLRFLDKYVPLTDKILIWQNILYRVLDMSTQYNLLYHMTQFIVFNKIIVFSFEIVYIVNTKKVYSIKQISTVLKCPIVSFCCNNKLYMTKKNDLAK